MTKFMISIELRPIDLLLRQSDQFDVGYEEYIAAFQKPLRILSKNFEWGVTDFYITDDGFITIEIGKKTKYFSKAR